MTRQQRWASAALSCVTRVRGKPEEGEYRTLCLKMPVLIHQSGLLPALTFMMSREKQGRSFCDDLATTYGVQPSETRDAAELLREQVLSAKELSTYLALTRDLIDTSIWFRRFADSELEAQNAEP